MTILPTIKDEQVKKLFDSNIIMVRELKNFSSMDLAELLSIDKPKAAKILREADVIL